MEQLEHALQPENYLRNGEIPYAAQFLAKERVLRISDVTSDYASFTVDKRYFRENLAHFFQWPNEMTKQCFLYIYSMAICLFKSGHDICRVNAESYLLHLTYSGSGKLEYEGDTYTLLPGDAFLINCRKAHHYYANSPQWGYYTIYLDGNAMPAFYQHLQQHNGFCFHIELNTPLFFSIRQLFHINDTQTPLTDLENNQALTYIMTEIVHTVRSKAILPDRIQILCAYLKDNYTQTITLDQLSEKFYLSKYYLCHRFRQYVGMSPIAYLNTQKIHMAEYYLVTTNDSIMDIAAKVGVNSANHFLYLFKRFAGMKPSEYRKKYSLKEDKA